MLPIMATVDKNNNVARTAPIPKKYTSALFIFPSAISVEKTPVQKRIVKGFVAVNRNPSTNVLPDFVTPNKLVFEHNINTKSSKYDI